MRRTIADPYSAEYRYKLQVAKARKLLSHVSEFLGIHEKEAAEDPTNWGYVGDMGHVGEMLEDVVTFLADED